MLLLLLPHVRNKCPAANAAELVVISIPASKHFHYTEADNLHQDMYALLRTEGYSTSRLLNLQWLPVKLNHIAA